ncbi:tripartite tricarboxylate transporter substrate binding protein [Fusibacter paucivorans]|uniref:Tripartite tricarboxylate transporter substrate binding protein n=2 Tax=Fusibacter paucivorans TaxID=76009 RepID=A0ABS5PNA6_9FIRM|nr:tripartite tricarboxylate transporter substrate binding protein [Fusibacter paucivorans]
MVLVGCGNDDGEKADKASPSEASLTSETSSDSDDAAAWAPSQNVEFIVTSSAGGGSDIFSRTITDIMTKEGLCSETFLVNNKTDGNGEVGRYQVANTKGDKADHTLLSMNSGDCMDMLSNTDNRLENFKTLALMAVDKQLVFVTPDGKYENFNQIIDTVQSGKEVIVGGSKGSDVATFEALLKELNVDGDLLKYIAYDSTSEAITAILGNHIDMVIAKPAASKQYVESESLIPILALSDERFDGNLGEAPTLSELGDYADVQVPVWRSVVAPGEMSDEAAAYWSEALKKVSESDGWISGYLEKNALIGDYMSFEETTAYLEAFQEDYLKTLEE